MGKGMLAITAMNLRNIPRRRGAALVVVVGIAGVVSVLLSLLAVATGMQQVVNGTARADRIIVLAKGTGGAESISRLSRADGIAVMEADGLKRKADGKAIASAEMLTVVPIARPGSKFDNYVPLRGVGLEGLNVRPEMKVVEGRMFQAGVHELIVGRMANKRFAALALGGRVRFEGGEWTIVGIFENGGNSRESELMTDANTLMSVLRRNAFNSVTAILDTPTALDRVKAYVEANPTLSVQVEPETAYYARQSMAFYVTLTSIGHVIGGFMAVGAFFGAMNSLYSTVSARRVEIATLRAIGFSPATVLVSVLSEALFLAILGALMGAGATWMLLDGNMLSSAGVSFSSTDVEQLGQQTFPVRLTLSLTVIGIIWALALGFIGALAPAVAAARLQITTALRRL